MIIDDCASAFYYMQNGDFAIVSPESVVATIEVKTTLNKERFKEAVSNISSVKRLYNDGAIPLGMVFGYQSNEKSRRSAKKIAEWANSIDLEYGKPDAVFWLRDDKAILGFNNATQGIGAGKDYFSTVFSGKGGTDGWELSAFLGLIMYACNIKSFSRADGDRISSYIGNRNITGYDEFPINW